MKISKLIGQLENIKAEYGNIEIMRFENECDEVLEDTGVFNLIDALVLKTSRGKTITIPEEMQQFFGNNTVIERKKILAIHG